AWYRWHHVTHRTPACQHADPVVRWPSHVACEPGRTPYHDERGPGEPIGRHRSIDGLRALPRRTLHSGTALDTGLSQRPVTQELVMRSLILAMPALICFCATGEVAVGDSVHASFVDAVRT